MLERIFSLSEHRSTAAREIVAGLTTFAAMAYILAVNPAILSQAGIDKGALVTATALASAVMTIIMALATNYPIALAPGMGVNAFFTYTICLGLKIAITTGIGFFIALIGLKNGGEIVANPATFVALGDLTKPAPWLVIIGIILTAILIARKIPGALILVIVLLSVVGFFVPASDGSGTLTKHPDAIFTWPSSLSPTFLKLDLSYFWQHLVISIPLVLALLFVDLFDNMGTLIGVTKRAGLLDEKGNLPKLGRALLADACAAMFGSTLGTSTVTSYIESAAGVEAGGRTGLTTIVTGCDRSSVGNRWCSYDARIGRTGPCRLY